MDFILYTLLMDSGCWASDGDERMSEEGGEMQHANYFLITNTWTKYNIRNKYFKKNCYQTVVEMMKEFLYKLMIK